MRETLLTRLIERLDNPHLVPLHRIDRATAGLVMLSRESGDARAYQALFREQRIRQMLRSARTGLPGLTFPLAHQSRIAAAAEFFRMREIAGAANSETTIDVLDRHATRWRYGLRPRTGRARISCACTSPALGAGILGDRLYPELQPRPLTTTHDRCSCWREPSSSSTRAPARCAASTANGDCTRT